jgi:hypothetical protein
VFTLEKKNIILKKRSAIGCVIKFYNAGALTRDCMIDSRS